MAEPELEPKNQAHTFNLYTTWQLYGGCVLRGEDWRKEKRPVWYLAAIDQARIDKASINAYAYM